MNDNEERLTKEEWMKRQQEDQLVDNIVLRLRGQRIDNERVLEKILHELYLHIDAPFLPEAKRLILKWFSQ